jgi:hypothetical protein
MPRVEFFWWAGCPSWDEALETLRDAMTAAGLDPDSIAVIELTNEDQARALGFPGSPTIRVDGADVEDPGENPIGLSCRVYKRADGRVSPLPDRAKIDAVLAGTGSAGR